MIGPAGALQAGFGDTVHDSQRVFRGCLDALSRPGLIQPFAQVLPVPLPMGANAAAVLLALADYETTVWLDAPFAAADGVADYIRFHTGARLTTDPAAADFAVASSIETLPPLSAFKQGTPEYPDRSTTLILQADDLLAAGETFEGPGINGTVAFSCVPQIADFEHQWQDNRDAFPCGVDLLFVTETALAGLPRSSRLMRSREAR